MHTQINAVQKLWGTFDLMFDNLFLYTYKS